MTIYGPDSARRRPRGRLLLALVVSLLSLGATGQAEEGSGSNPRLFILPVPGTITIDGNLADWDRSGGLHTFATEALKDRQAITTYAMYDDEAIYLAADVWDESPMLNRHDPKANPERAWDADSYQFRIYLKPQFPGTENKFAKPAPNYAICHLLLWYYTLAKEPNLQLRYGMAYALPKEDWFEGIVPHDRFQAAYRQWDKGNGYTFEYRIPWSVLSNEFRPTAGDVTAAALQCQWSRADGLKQIASAKDLERQPGFQFQASDVWGKAIFATRGQLPAEAMRAAAARDLPEPMPLAFAYDLPKDGHAVVSLWDETNTARAFVVVDQPRQAGPVTEKWSGLDLDGNILKPGTYTWKGLVHDGLTTEFILSVHNAGTPPYKTDDNTGGWGGDHGEPTTVAAAGDKLLLAWSICESGWGIIRTDLDGDKEWGIKHSAAYLAATADRYFAAGGHAYQGANAVRVYALADSRPMAFAATGAYAENPPGADAADNAVSGLAYADGLLYVAYAQRNLIAVNDAVTGKLRFTVALPAPHRMKAAPDGSILAIAGQGIVHLKVDRDKLARFAADGPVIDGASVVELRPAAASHLDEPSGVAVDAQGRVYVANQGKLQNVSVFDVQGQYLKSIGKPGGRPPVGDFERDGMLAPGGIAIDRRGRLWVAETLDFPKRISVWDTETGACDAEYFGASSYFGWAWMDPAHPDEIYCHNVLWKVDLDQRTKQIVSTIWRKTADGMIPPVTASGYGGHFRVITAANGRQFGFGLAGASRGSMLYMREGNIFKPIAGMIGIVKDPYPVLDDFLDELAAQYKKDRVPGHRQAQHLFWQDRNDDQTVQVDEVAVPPGRGGYFNWIAPDLTAWCDAGYTLRPARFEGDRPIYDFSQLEAVPFTGSNSNCASLWLDAAEADAVYRLNPGKPDSLSKWTVGGERLWSYGNLMVWRGGLNKPAMKAGDLFGLTMPLGLAGDYTGSASYFGPYHLFTRDGLYVDMIMRTARDGKGLGADITASETLTGQLVKPDGMNRWFLLAGDQDGRITEVHGLDTVQRLAGGTVTLRQEDVDRVATARREYEEAKRGGQPLYVQRYRASLDRPTGEVGKRVDDQRAFTAQLAYDQTNLYLQVRVSAPAPLVNDAADPNLLFKGGNLIDLQLGTDPEADPKRLKPVPGDLRLLIGRRPDGTPVAVLFRPKVQGFAGQPIVLESPTGTESFDAIEPVAVELTVKPVDGGFEALATVPLATLGWQPAAGATTRLDVGYIYGNQKGTGVALRSYWHNDSFAANVTDDVPHESRLEPSQWGLAILE